MAARKEMQFEKLIDGATRKKDFQSLEQFLAAEDSENVSHRCSKQFVNKLDKLLCRELDKQDVKSISTILNSILKFGKKVSIAGEDGLPALIKYGLIGRIKEILIFNRNEKNETLTNLVENFFNVLLAVCDSRPEGKIQILENFLLRTCTLITDVQNNIYVQQEVVRKLNLMLQNAPQEAMENLFSTKQMLLVTSEMGKRILDAGDYDLQVAITEALCRMISEKQRAELACQWFSMEFMSNAFKGIKVSEFETDCRKFLNQVNGMLGDKRRVFTYPCLAAALDKSELQMPVDENLEDFWVDFNVGSRSISFFVAGDDTDHQWETVIIPEEKVDLYNLEEKESKQLLTIDLKSPMNVGNQEGGRFFLYFNSILDIKDVTRRIYGFSKCKCLTKKRSASVAKTTVRVIFDESGSQILVPESQLSPHLEEKAEEEKLAKYKTRELPGASRTLNSSHNEEECRGDSSKKIPSCKRKVSEASVIIPGIKRFPAVSPLGFVSTSTPCKGRFKVPLEMMSSERSNNEINETRTKNFSWEPTGRVCAEEGLEITRGTEIEVMQNQALDEALDAVPDSQPVGRSNKPSLPTVLESSFDKTKTWKKRMCSVPEKNITTGDKQKLKQSLAPASHPDRVLETSLHLDFTKAEPRGLLTKETGNPKQSKAKTKSKEVTDATKSLISKISDRYKVKAEKNKARDSLCFDRSHLNKSGFSKEEVQDRNLKINTSLNSTASHTIDVYNFNISGFDEPTIKLGIKESRVSELNVRVDANRNGNADANKTSTEVKERKKTRNNQNKKHLFSDTDTEFRGDDSTTDISWLQQPNRKPKAQLIDYSRNKNLWKPKTTDKRADTLPEPACHTEKPKGKTENKKKTGNEDAFILPKKKKSKEQNPRTDEMVEKTTRENRPRRAILAKNYKELSSSESENEVKSSMRTSKENKSKKQKCMNGKNRDDNQPKELPNIVFTEPVIEANYVQKAFVKLMNSAEKQDIEMPSSKSPASIETMRSAERISEGDVTQEHVCSERSPGLLEATPDKMEMSNFEQGLSPNNFYPQKNGVQHPNQTPEPTAKKLTFESKIFSPILTEASLLSLKTNKKVSGKQVKGSASEMCDDNIEDLSFGHGFSDTLSPKGQLQDPTGPITKSKEEDQVPLSPSSASSGSEMQSEEHYGPMHESGPTIQTLLKQPYHSETESSSDEAESHTKKGKKGQRRQMLQPRKLFKSDDSVTYRISESISAVAVRNLPGLDGESWDPDCSSISIHQKLQKECTKKIERRSRKMEYFTKQSLRIAHEHWTTMSYQLHECRIRQLDKFHFTLLEELKNFEKDSESLKNMEKEFSNFFKKHTQTFSTFRKNEQQRIQILKASFDKNIYHTTDYEEHIFTSEMHLMKEDIKGLQEKLLKEMQEEELCNVRRGLQMFFQSTDKILK